ncbi:MAG: hypothetical protein ABXS91_11145 [Sulfurimonas sp.]
MTPDQFNEFLKKHEIKEQFYIDVKSENSLSEDKQVEDKIAVHLDRQMSPFIWLVDFGECETDWNHYDDIWDAESRCV